MDDSEYTRRVRAKLPPEAAHVPVWDPTVSDDRPDVPVWRYRSIADGTELIPLYAAWFGLALQNPPSQPGVPPGVPGILPGVPVPPVPIVP
ncbi:hypothetical protein [Nocardia sp. NPDC056100]|uniref:hypothetical protein n=1 Tax=Nocardia sp. NPDC056100 TaxID=3345712 RepID=UPI0035DBD865